MPEEKYSHLSKEQRQELDDKANEAVRDLLASIEDDASVEYFAEALRGWIKTLLPVILASRENYARQKKSAG
jgi:hypothetical protein